MPPRFAYWTILAGGLPTAFRATERDELLPTFQRLREKHPDAVMKWFSRGKLWDSPEQARESSQRSPSGSSPAHEPGSARRPSGGGSERRPSGPSGGGRPKEWRPGGDHRDPRQKYKDAKKAHNIEHRQQKFARKHGGSDAQTPREKPHGDKVLDSRKRGEGWTLGEGTARQPQRPDWRDRGGKPDWRDRNSKPGARDRNAKPEWRDHNAKPESRDRNAKPQWRDRNAKPEWRDRNAKPESRDRNAKPEWRDRNAKPQWRDRDRPPRERPHGDPLRDDIRTGGAAERTSGRDRPNDARQDKRPYHARDDNRPHHVRDDRRAQTRDWRDDRGNQQPRSRRPFQSGGFARNQGTDEPPAPPRPRGPNREPLPSEQPKPTPPPRPSEPSIPPPGPPERGRRAPYPKRRRE